MNAPTFVNFFVVHGYSLYIDIKIDVEQTLEDLKNAFGRALPFAVEIGYTTPETITFMIGKAGRNEKVIEGLLGKEKVEKVTEEKEMEEGFKSERIKKKVQQALGVAKKYNANETPTVIINGVLKVTPGIVGGDIDDLTDNLIVIIDDILSRQ